MKLILFAYCLLTGLLALVHRNQTASPVLDAADSLQVQIVTDRFVYHPGSTARVKFLVTNAGHESFYLFRGAGLCSSQIGSFDLQIHDRTGRVVHTQDCSVDFKWDEVDVVKMLTDPRSGVELEPGELFGSDNELRLPKQKGTYRIEGTFVPAGYTDEQRTALAEKKLRVPLTAVSAKKITITVD